MALKYKLSVPNGTYMNKEGVEKTAWLNIGAVMSKQNGGFVMKLDAIPTNVIDKDGNSVAFNGWVNMFPHEPDNQGQQAHPNNTGGIAEPQGGFNKPEPPAGNFDEEIPFIDPYKFNWRVV